MTKFELLVGADVFWRRALEDMRQARRRLYVQAMTFEGDRAGQGVASAILASPVADRRVLVDDYSRLVINDRWLASARARRDLALQAEVQATRTMFQSMIHSGVTVNVTNPVAGRWWRYPARNHKKLIIADDIAYIGGVNFADHNFAWHDFMLRLEGVAAADFLSSDFLATFMGRPRATEIQLGDLTLQAWDGRNNTASIGPILDMVRNAQTRITVISPYVSFPFTDSLSQAARRGVSVELITPAQNNKPIVRDALLATATKAGFQVSLTPGMSHLKGLQIDETHLIVGSANFDFVSLAAEEELIAIITAPAVIAEFRDQIIGPAMVAALDQAVIPLSRHTGLASQLALRLVQVAALNARRSARGVVPWG